MSESLPGNINYRPDVDGLRALAVLGVLVFHAFPEKLAGGFAGVDVFFVISGFLITGILLREQDQGVFSFRAFYARRIRRIFPALFCVLAAVLIFGWFVLFNDEYKTLGKHVFGGAAFIANIFYWQEIGGYWDVSSSLKPLVHLWSLGIEEQFYIFFPLLLWLAFKKKIPLLIFLCLLWIASFALNIGFYKRDAVLDFYAPFTRFWELACGSILACLFQRHQLTACPWLLKCDALLGRIFPAATLKNNEAVLRNALAIIGAGLIIVAFFSSMTSRDFPGFRALLPTLGTAFLIAAGTHSAALQGGSWINRRLLAHPLMVGIGLISYPLYLWHWPLLSFAHILNSPVTATWEWCFTRLAALGLAFVLAILTYKYIENPIRWNKQRRGLKTAALACLMAIIGLSGLAVWLKDGLPRHSSVKQIAQIEEQFIPWEEVVKRYEAIDLHTLGLNVNGERTVAIIGDSHAGSAFPAIAAYNKKNGVNTIIIHWDGGDFKLDKYQESIKRIASAVQKEKRITDVLLIYRGMIYYTGQDYDHPEDSPHAQRVKLGPVFEQYLQEQIDTLVSLGKKVWLVSENPVFRETPLSFLRKSVVLNQAGTFPTMPLAEVQEHQKPYLDMLSRLKNVTVIYSLDAFCPNGICPMFDPDGIPIYRDKNHLSYDAGSRWLVDRVLAPYLDEMAKRQ